MHVMATLQLLVYLVASEEPSTERGFGVVGGWRDAATDTAFTLCVCRSVTTSVAVDAVASHSDFTVGASQLVTLTLTVQCLMCL